MVHNFGTRCSLSGEIAQIVSDRQKAFRLANSFPSDTLLTDEQRSAVIERLPPVDAPNVIALRLGAFVCNSMKSLDLIRNDEMYGNWSAGETVDNMATEYLNDLFGNDRMLHELGVVTLGSVIDRNQQAARPSSHADIVTPEHADEGIFLVTRQRMVARLAVRATGRLVTIHKRSEFGLYATRDPDPSHETTLRADAIARGGFRLGFGTKYGYSIDQMNEMHRMLRDGFNAKIEEAITNRAPHLQPLSMGYYARLRKRSKKR